MQEEPKIIDLLNNNNVNLLFSFLRITNDRHDEIAFKNIVRSNLFNFDYQTRVKICNVAMVKGISYKEALRFALNWKEIDISQHANIICLEALLNYLSKMSTKNESPYKMASFIYNSSQYQNQFKLLDTENRGFVISFLAFLNEYENCIDALMDDFDSIAERQTGFTGSQTISLVIWLNHIRDEYNPDFDRLSHWWDRYHNLELLSEYEARKEYFESEMIDFMDELYFYHPELKKHREELQKEIAERDAQGLTYDFDDDNDEHDF